MPVDPHSVSDRLAVTVGIVGSVSCVVYLCLVGHGTVSTAYFAPIFRVLLVADTTTAWLALAVCLAAVTVSLTWRYHVGFMQTLVATLGKYPRIVCGGVMAALALGAVFVYRDYPLSMDEYAAVFQSKVFATGHPFATLPASVLDWLIVRGFNGSFLFASHVTGETVEGYLPGFALILAPFQFLRIPWACNPLLSALSLYLIFNITLALTCDRLAAGATLLLAMASGAFIAYGIAYYSMQAHLTLNLLFAYLLLRPSRWRCFAAGLAGSLALLLHNPFPHGLFALPWISALAFDKYCRRLLLPLLIGYVPGLCIGAGWLMLRTSIVPAHTVALVSGVGSGAFVWPDAALLAVRMASIVKLWLWAVPGLAAMAWVGYRAYRDDRNARLLAHSAAITFFGYLFVRFDQGHGWGYRYFQSAWGILPILAGCALSKNGILSPKRLAVTGYAAVLSLLAIVPWQLYQIDTFMKAHLAQLAPLKRPGRNVFFINPLAGFYLADMIQYDAMNPRSDLFLASRGVPLDAELLRQNWPDARRVALGSWGQQWVVDLAGAVDPGDGAGRGLNFTAPDPKLPR